MHQNLLLSKRWGDSGQRGLLIRLWWVAKVQRRWDSKLRTLPQLRSDSEPGCDQIIMGLWCREEETETI